MLNLGTSWNFIFHEGVEHHGAFLCRFHIVLLSKIEPFSRVCNLQHGHILQINERGKLRKPENLKWINGQDMAGPSCGYLWNPRWSVSLGRIIAAQRTALAQAGRLSQLSCGKVLHPEMT